MTILSTGWLLNTLRPTLSHVTSHVACPAIYLQSRDYAARKGTRVRKAALLKARKAKKAAAAAAAAAKRPAKLLTSANEKESLKFIDDSKKTDIPSDSVYIAKFYKWKVYSFQDALQCHRETHDPTIYNEPNAYLGVLIDLNLQTRKKTKFIEKIDRIAHLPHVFPQSVAKSIIFFSDDLDHQHIAREAGANIAAGIDLLRQIQTGVYSLEEHDYFLAHPDILPQLLLLKGIFKSRLPSQLTGTLSSDVKGLVEKYRNGVHYELQKSLTKPDYGIVKGHIGTLDMDTKLLEENYAAFVQDVMKVAPKREGPFIVRTRLYSPPSKEQLVVNHAKYITSNADTSDSDEDEEDTRGVIGSV